MVRKSLNLILLALIAALPAFTGWLAKDLAAPFPGPGTATFFVVEKGRGVRAVTANLRKAGILPDSLAPTFAYDLYYSRERFKAGEYEFTFPLKPRDALFKIFRGKIYLHPITIPEGLTGAEISDIIRAQQPAGADSFGTAFRRSGLIADWDAKAGNLEGYMFPDTYSVPRKTTGEELVAAMVAQFRKVFDADRRRRAAAFGMSVRDVVILASLIEKETGRPEERPLVSAVFHNRLRIGMKLDCDPTIIYALKLENRYTGRLLSRDLKFPSPYNTYLHAGLPPGPICNPGLQSIEAALSPAPDDYLYFVAQVDGRHHFSRTIGEHQEAVRRFQLKKK